MLVWEDFFGGTTYLKIEVDTMSILILFCKVRQGKSKSFPMLLGYELSRDWIIKVFCNSLAKIEAGFAGGQNMKKNSFLLLLILIGAIHNNLLAAKEGFYAEFSRLGMEKPDEKVLFDLQTYLGDPDPEIKKGRELVFSSAGKQEKNHAFYLLYHLAQKHGLGDKDSIYLALALVNSHLYALADEETRALIEADILKQAQFYQFIIEWQKKEGLPYTLKAAPLTAKIFWAERGAILHPLHSGNKNYLKNGLNSFFYRELVDRVENLYALHKIIVKNKLIASTLDETAAALEDFVHQRRFYLSSMENMSDFFKRKMLSEEQMKKALDAFKAGEYQQAVLGHSHRWDDFRWLNYQCGLFDKNQEYRGDCGGTTAVQMGYYKAAGIAPASFQWIDPEGNAAFTHNFPGYYHPLYQRWFSVQKPVFYDKGGKEIPLRPSLFHFTKPIYHSALYHNRVKVERTGPKSRGYRIFYEFYPGELTDSRKIRHLLTLGMTGKEMEKIFYSERTMSPGWIFHERSAPDQLPDQDSDGLPDQLEKSLGTNLLSPDTDGDGYSDKWEMDQGFDPKNPASRPDKKILAIDGLSGPEMKGAPYSWVEDKKGDVRSREKVLDIRFLSGAMREGKIHLGVGFYHPEKIEKPLTHSFHIIARGERKEEFWVQWHRGKSSIQKKNPSREGDWQMLGQGVLSFAMIEDGEFMLDPAWFEGFQSIEIRYHAPGFFEGKEQVTDDISDIPLILYLWGQDWRKQWGKAEKVIEIVDLEKDSRQDINPPLDIKSFSFFRDGKYLYAKAKYYPIKNLTQAGSLHTIYLRHEASGSHYWIQFWMGGQKVHFWKDGQKGRDLEAVPAGLAWHPGKEEAFFRVPLEISKHQGPLVIQYRTGGQDGAGKWNSDGDLSESGNFE